MVNKARRIALPPQPIPRAPRPQRPRAHHPDTLRNLSNRAGAKGGARLEETAPSARPSRKSTRGSEGHIKVDGNLRQRQMRRAGAPSMRAAQAQAQRAGR